jgi:glycosyltransferase involved in cell wall biosynthesis
MTDEGRSPHVLYVSYDGALEALGQSQVVAYLERLGRGRSITLVSFEKPADLADADRVRALRDRLTAAGVRWRPLRYHKWPATLSTAWDVARGIAVAIREHRRGPIRLLHARGYVAGLVGLVVRRATGARLLFDMRAFWVDEKVAAGQWRPSGPLYRAGKACERRFFTSADAVVSLTATGVEAARRLGYATRPDTPVTVIPTCTDLRRFRPGPRDPVLSARLGLGTAAVIGCVGTLRHRYLRRSMLEYLACLTASFERLVVLIVTEDDHVSLQRDAGAAGVPTERLRITRAAFADMPAYLRLMDAGLFFLRAALSTAGSLPTKAGELLATGVPVITNQGAGEVGGIIRTERVGIVLGDVTRSTFLRSLPAVAALLADSDIPARCRATAERWFDLDIGVDRYARLYARLQGAPHGERDADDPAMGDGSTRSTAAD